MLSNALLVSTLGRARQRTMSPRTRGTKYERSSSSPEPMSSLVSANPSPSYRPILLKYISKNRLASTAFKNTHWPKRMLYTSRLVSSQEALPSGSSQLPTDGTGSDTPQGEDDHDNNYQEKLKQLLKETEKIERLTRSRVGPKDKFVPSQASSSPIRKSSEEKPPPKPTSKDKVSTTTSRLPSSTRPEESSVKQVQSTELRVAPPKPKLDKTDMDQDKGEETTVSASAREEEVLGRITPKRLTIEEAEALGIDTSQLKSGTRASEDGSPSGQVGSEGPSDGSVADSTTETTREPLYEDPEAKKKRLEDEKLQEALKRDGRPRLPTYITKAAEWSKTNYIWLLVAGLIVLPQFLDDRTPDRGRKRMEFEESWHRGEYHNLSDLAIEKVIFELCGLAAMAALPPFNPLHAPLTAVRGEIRPVYPEDRQGTGPPTIWKLRIDFPAARETIYEKNSHLEATVVPVRPDYKGSQFMWILSRTWENGEPVIRILMGKQVGGTIKANPKRSLIPWRMPVFRPRRLQHEISKHTEMDMMYHELYMDQTRWYQAFKRFGDLDTLLKNQIEWNLDEMEYDMLEAKGFGDLLYNPNSQEWPHDSKSIIVDPLGIHDQDDTQYYHQYGQEDGSEYVDDYGPAQYTKDGPDGYDYDDYEDYDDYDHDHDYPNQPHPDDISDAFHAAQEEQVQQGYNATRSGPLSRRL